MVRLAIALFAIAAGFHGFTAALPLALAGAGVADPEIGLIVGSASLIQIPAAFAAGALLDRYGGKRLMVVGCVAYVLAAGVMLLPGVEAGGSQLPFFVARILQGIGVATALPAGLSLVPRLLPPDRRGLGLAFVGAAQNLTLVALPPLSIVVLGVAGLDGVALLAIGLVAFGVLITAGLRPGPMATDAIDHLGPAARRLGFAFRPSWTIPLAVVLLFVAHWGVVTAYLPQRAEAAGANIGLFFVADGIAILISRIPTGWLADRIKGRWLVLSGIGLTSTAVALLLLPPTTPILVLSGILGGAGGGLVLTPLLLEVSRRSGDADRGSAFALYSTALAGAIALGSVGGAPIVALAGFEGAIVAGLLAMVAAAVLTLLDRGLGRAPAR